MRQLLLAAVLAAAACSKAPPPPAETPLQSAAQAASAAPACAKLIPSQWSPSLPVPALEGGKLVYKLFFYGRDGNPQSGFTFHRAEGDATLDEGGAVLSCSMRPGSAGLLPKYVPPPGLTLDELSRRELELYPQLEDAGRLYAKGGEVAPDDKKKLAAASEAFLFFVQDGQGPDYRALSPGFWSWIEKNGGRAPK